VGGFIPTSYKIDTACGNKIYIKKLVPKTISLGTKKDDNYLIR